MAFIAFDILFDGGDDLRDLPLTARRARLERVFGNTGSPLLRLSDFVAGRRPRALRARRSRRGWEGLVAKHLDSRYKSGKRTPDWRKLKITLEQEFVVGGWTEPRNSRGYLGALLLGVYDGGSLEYVGHTGTGFTEAELQRVWTLLKALEIPAEPVPQPSREPNERPHWAKPELVAQVRFTEWTDDGKLRHPIYLGLRDDVEAADVHREPVAAGSREMRRNVRSPDAHGHASNRHTALKSPQGANARKSPRSPNRQIAKFQSHSSGPLVPRASSPSLVLLIEALADIETRGGDGRLTLPDGDRLKVGNLDKVFWPDQRLTKGDLLRYYAAVSPRAAAGARRPAARHEAAAERRARQGVLPAAGARGRAAGRARGDAAGRHRGAEPADRRLAEVAALHDAAGGDLAGPVVLARHVAGLSRTTWRSTSTRCRASPSSRCSTSRAGCTTNWRRSACAGFPKTSGADGLHIYIPLPPDTPYDTAVVFCQLLATVVAQKHPQAGDGDAERARARPQGLRGLPAERARQDAGDGLQRARRASTPACRRRSTWEEVHAGVEREDFNLQSMPARRSRGGRPLGRPAQEQRDGSPCADAERAPRTPAGLKPAPT